MKFPKQIRIAKHQKRTFGTSKPQHLEKAVIVGTARTPFGSFGGGLKSFSASELGGLAIRGAMERAGITKNDVQEVIMGNVCQANQGQAPAKQASYHAGLPDTVCATTVNKMCASGMKTIMMAAQSVMLGQRNCVIAGGFESMSNVPHYIQTARWGKAYGDDKLVDGLARDGLSDAYNKKPMGWCAEQTAKKFNLTREMQDEYALQSYKRAQQATKDGKFKSDILSVSVESRRGTTYVTEDEDITNIVFEKVPKLRSPFEKGGSVTAANASTISDGGSAVVVMSETKAKKGGYNILAEIVDFADAERHPEEFTIAPSDSVKLLLKNNNMTKDDVDLWEFNEAFAVVALANMQILGLDDSNVNIYGGAISLGHPIGCSASRITANAIHQLYQEDKSVAVASVCNGGGGASAIMLRKPGN